MKNLKAKKTQLFISLILVIVSILPLFISYQSGNLHLFSSGMLFMYGLDKLLSALLDKGGKL